MIYRQADRVVVLGPYMGQRIRDKGVRSEDLVTIPVWSRRDEVYPLPRAGHPLRARLGLDDRFVAMYSGNLGLAHSFHEFVAAANRLRDDERILFLFVGDGPRMAEVKRAVAAEGLTNVQFLDPFPREELHLSLTMADVHLISMRSEMTGIVVPGKLYGALATGRPAVFIGPDRCESADTIRQAGAGLTVPLGDVDALVDALVGLAGDPGRAEAMGRRGQAAFLADYERDPCCALWNDLIDGLLAPAPARAADRPEPAAHPALRNANGFNGVN